MEKKFSKIEISVIKSAAKNAAPFVAKKAKVDVQIEEAHKKMQKLLEEKIQKLEAEKAGYQAIIDSMNQAVKQITGGYTTEDLVDIKKEATGQMDAKTGKEIFKTVYVLKYPETVVPPTVEGAGSDYDKDAETVAEAAEEGVEEEMPEELAQEAVEIAESADDADPFADVDPFAGEQ